MGTYILLGELIAQTLLLFLLELLHLLDLRQLGCSLIAITSINQNIVMEDVKSCRTKGRGR